MSQQSQAEKKRVLKENLKLSEAYDRVNPLFLRVLGIGLPIEDPEKKKVERA